MKKFEEIKFKIPELKGISAKNVEEHLKLYAGYVKNSNLILEKIDELSKDAEKNDYLLAELQRRFGFEFCGMRNHEYYFRSLEGGAKFLDDKSALKKSISETWGSFDNWLTRFKSIALTRGIGWAVLFYDPQTKSLLNTWVDEHHIGNLSGLSFIMGIDMWEHAFMIDYLPSQKKDYVSAFFDNINWTVAEENFKRSI
ncbi:MAG: superoxide dismutase [Patescibacteria group bacterium]|nr:superoxide dismutase [Patescibacteria group bacterium]MDE2217930.1 superoxide dismutase [Patescibacteria group bacterium]